MSDELQNDTQVEFLDFVPPAEPETVAEAEPDIYEEYLKNKAARDAQLQVDLERKRFEGVRSGQVEINSSLGPEYLEKLDAWAKTQYEAAWKTIQNIPHVDAKRMDAFLELYEKFPEIPLYLKFLETSDPTKFKKFCDSESSSSSNARIIFNSNRSVAEMKRKDSAEYKDQVKAAENARLHKEGQANSPNYFLCKEMFKNGYPNDEVNRLMVNKETRPQAMQLIADAAKWNMIDPTSRLAQTAQQFVKAESSYSADPKTNQNIWAELIPEGEISAEDKERVYRVWGGKSKDGATLEMKLKAANPAEYARLRKCAEDMDVLPKASPKPVFNTTDDLGSAPRPGSPAWKEYQKKLDAKLARLAELQKGKKNPHMKF